MYYDFKVTYNFKDIIDITDNITDDINSYYKQILLFALKSDIRCPT